MINIFALMQNKRFIPGGRGPVEFDCFGFCAEVYRQHGIDLPTDYAAPVDNGERDAEIRNAMDSPRFTKLDRPEVPCLVALMMRPPYVTHVGVMISPTEFIHIVEKIGVSVTNINLEIWTKRIAGFYRYTGGSR